MRKIHCLKISEYYFHAIATGAKNFEVRQYTSQGPDKPARDFAKHDVLRLSIASDVEGTVLDRSIQYVLKDTDPGMKDILAPGYCILGLRAPETEQEEFMNYIEERATYEALFRLHERF